ncbi:MAG: bifunctional DNA primase/polymerase [Nocardioides sp.]
MIAAAGVPVFPCVPGGKQPATEHGFHDATTDPQRAVAWWRRWPEANIGVPTGAASGLVVVDVDVHGPVNGYAAFERAEYAGRIVGWQVMVDTPSGGMHAYYPATPDVTQPCWQAARAGVDFRGDGGYVVVPPSRTVSDGEVLAYRVRTVNVESAGVLDAERLRDFLDPRPAPTPRGTARPEREADASRLAAWVANRAEGERNRGLFWAACRLAENGIRPSDALDALSAAASRAGLAEREINATVRSAYRTVRPTPAPGPPNPTARTGGTPASCRTADIARGL